MRHDATRTFWLELATAAVSTALLVVTAIWPDWIEMVFGVDPDGGSGSLEWAIVGAAAAIAVVSALLARREWRRSSLATG